MTPDGIAICEALAELQVEIVALRACLDYCLLIGCMILGGLFWRLAVLGKNQRNFW